MPTKPPPKRALIIVGASARAAAASARRAGLDPWCVDLFADRDLRAIAPVRRCPLQDYPDGMAALLRDAPDAPVLLTGAMENHPEAVAAIARERPLLGPPPEAIRAARDPHLLAGLPGVPGLGRCAVRFDAAEPGLSIPSNEAHSPGPASWVRKPLRSAGGRGVQMLIQSPAARPGATVSAKTEAEAAAGHLPDHYFQQFIPGSAVGAVFVAGRHGLRLAGISRQIVGDPSLGATGFQYVGSLGPIALTERQRFALVALGEMLVERAGLRGLFGVDLILDPTGDLWPIEVNPRYPASVEVLEAAGAAPVLADLDEFQGGEARPPGDTAPAATSPVPGSAVTPIHGKAIAFARESVVAPDLYAWFAPDEIADVPEAGEPTPAGRPICTLLAHARTEQACLARLHALADRLYTRLST